MVAPAVPEHLARLRFFITTEHTRRDIDRSAHGTPKPLGDVAEIVAITAVFGDHAAQIPVSSTKSMMGHLTAAAGAAEACLSILALTTGVIPPTINLDQRDPAIDLDCMSNASRRQECGAVMSNSFGFGGTNAVLVFARVGDR